VNVSRSVISPAQLDASRFALVSRLADDLAHEIKNPLHAMVINLEVLKRRVEKGAREASLERAAVLENEVQRLHILVESLLRLLRPSREGEGPFSSSQVLDELRPLFELRARIARVEYSQDSGPVEAYTPVKPDILRFALLFATDLMLDVAKASSGQLSLNAEELPQEILFRIGCSTRLDRAARDHALHFGGDGFRGLPAAAALLATAGGTVGFEEPASHGTTVLLRVPRSRFI
jgi:signal transduction histidine kinase